MGRLLEGKSIKSARRVFEVLEFFDSAHPEASVMDITKRYGYPQSSASELLSYMVSLGYLRRGSTCRTYQLTIRAAMLGSWVQPKLVREGRLLPLMDTLAEETGCTIVLSGNNGVRLQCFHAVAGQGDTDGPHQGDMLPLLRSAEGRALLARTDRGLVRKYLHRLNAEAEDSDLRIRYDDLAADLDQIEKRGYARIVADDRISLAIMLPHGDTTEPLSLSIHGSAEEDEAFLLRSLQSAVARHLGLYRVPQFADVPQQTPMRATA
jgi:DNA-binding IclR family transcriptional regulator